LEDLSNFEEKSRKDLQSLTIAQLTINSEMQDKINEVKESIHKRRMFLGDMRRCYIEKRKIIKCLQDGIQEQNSTVFPLFLNF